MSEQNMFNYPHYQKQQKPRSFTIQNHKSHLEITTLCEVSEIKRKIKGQNITNPLQYHLQATRKQIKIPPICPEDHMNAPLSQN